VPAVSTPESGSERACAVTIRFVAKSAVYGVIMADLLTPYPDALFADGMEN